MADGAKIAKQARNSAPNAGAFGDCPRCDKLGLPILPLRFAYTPKKEVSGKAAGAPDVVNEGNAFAGGDMVVRVLSDGYLYVLDERGGGNWRAFAVTKDGALWEFPPDTPPKSKAEFNCGRTGHSVKSSMFSIPKPAEAKRVWMAYTSVVLTKARRDAYKAACLSNKPSDEEILLKDRFQEYSVAELLNNPKPRTGCPAFSVDPEGRLLAHYVPEYAGLHTLFNQSLTPGINRQADAREAGQRMHRMMPGHGAAVILHDPVGLAMEIRAMANAAHAKLANVDKKYARQLRVDRAIDQIGKSFIKSGKQEEWEDDYLSGVDPSKRNAFKKAYENETKPLKEQRAKFCSDYVTWQRRSTFTVARDWDYDNEDSECCKAFSQQMAAVLDGVGLTENERAFALESLAKIDNNNLWFRVLTGNQKTLMDYLLNEKRADLNDMFKNTYSAVDEWVKTYEKLAKELRLAANQPIPAGAAASEPDAFFRATLPVGEAIKRTVYNVQGFLSDAKLVSLHQLRVLAVAGLLWFKITAVPFVEEMTAAVAARKQKQAVWKQTLESRLTSMVDADGVKINRMNVGDVTDELGDIAHVRIRVVAFAFMVADAPQGRLVFSSQLNYEAVIARLQANGILTTATGALGDASVSQLVRANSAVNTWDETLKMMRSGGAAGTLAVIAGTFQGISLSEALEKQGKTPNAKPVWQIVSASIGLLGAAAEISAATMTVASEMRGVSITSAAPKNLAGVGGILGGIAGVIAGIVTIWDGTDLVNDGDTDAGVLTIFAGLVLTGGGVAGAVGGLASMTAAGVLLGLGPAGWAVLAIGAAIIGIALLFGAESAKDNPLETWIKKSCLGEVASYSERDELAAYAELFKLPLEVKMSWGVSVIGTGATVVVAIEAPAVDAKSWLEYELSIHMSDGRVLRAREQRPANPKLPGGILIDPDRIATGRAKGLMDGNGFVHGQTDRGGAQWEISFLTKGWLNDLTVTKVGVMLKYWPNKAENPDLVLPSLAGKLFEITQSEAK